MAADGVSRAVAECRPNLRTVEVVRAGKRVEGVVEQDVAITVDERYAQLLEGPLPARRKDPGVDAVVQGIEHPEIDQLQMGVQLLGLEVPLAAVLEEDETGDQRPEKDQQQQKQLPVVGESNP